jgi:hypothetical protein
MRFACRLTAAAGYRVPLAVHNIAIIGAAAMDEKDRIASRRI